ncbi:PKD domain-containing protein [Kitasatospora sp. NPDC091207]|uniref:PKD domain-containing protein n=1 Tax=Kitasatospora sp. NPDC091207 TaxID=3364083 RepID=UPI0038160FA2
MRRARIPVAALLGLSVIGAGASAGTARADVTDLYVDKTAAACSNTSGSAGSKATPYCTIAAATAVVLPGQTVHIAGGSYQEGIQLTRSGTPSAPITILGKPYVPGDEDVTTLSPYGTLPHLVSLTGVHDVVLGNLFGQSWQEGALVTDSQRVTLDRLVIFSSGGEGAGYPGVRITGASSDVTLSRSSVTSSHAAGVRVEGGLRTVLTTNEIDGNAGQGVVLADAPDSVVTGNTVAGVCGPMIELAGASTGTTLRNNVLDQDEHGSPAWGHCASTAPGDLAVSAASTAGTTADYNLVTTGTAAPYSWAGQGYATVGQFRQGTGQGAHDLTASREDLRKPNSPAVDSADAGAPGALGTDLLARPRVDNPLVANTGTGAGYHDRGAVEEQDPLAASLSQTQQPAGQPLTFVFDGRVESTWAAATTTLDFGDGSAPVSPVTFPVKHDYAEGTYQATLTATDALGLTRTATSYVGAKVGPIQPRIQVWAGSGGSGLDVTAYAPGTVSPWPVASYRYDFGDGTAPSVVAPSVPSVRHFFAKPGTYTVTVTVTDDHGRSASAAQAVSVATPIAGRWGAGQQGAAVGYFNEGLWNLLNTNTPGAQKNSFRFGQAGDIPVAGDWERVGYDQPGIYRPDSNTFALRHVDETVTAVAMGRPGDIPVPGNWDHNGHAQLAVYRPGTGQFVVRHDDGSYTAAYFGGPGDLPVVGDWDGVGHTQMGVFRASAGAGGANLFALRHDDGSVSTASYGAAGDLPVVGDWSGVGRTTFGVYRPSEAKFHLSRSYVGQSDIVFP